MPQILLNADDFGRHACINAAVRESVERGLLRSASLMAGEPAFDDAVDIAKAHPTLGVGIHFTLVDGRPVLPPEEIPSLVGADGRFRPDHGAFVKDFLCGRIRRADIRRELTAQAQKIVAAGIRPDHVDSHQHIHMLPGIFSIALDVAAQYGIRAVRISQVDVGEASWLAGSLGDIIGRAGLFALGVRARRLARRRGFAAPAHFAGLVAGAAVTPAFLVQLADSLARTKNAGATEVMMHPGTSNAALVPFTRWQHDFEVEFTAATSADVRAAFSKNALTSVRFSEILL
ncbi:ChbG/HpnK family deacetylase [Selenomonas sp.]|uniref:ChbG/HpnK family deacetylase n=1 Tax=Selenomonas sp. TaxID=2053611 RepID=UPI002A765CBF|nr:ChbG/HpnK family deacetylase [Selenomonas sp.]MDY3297477.1 ChbG/HpnK family deacetylase [Selenomonas sp.]